MATRSLDDLAPSFLSPPWPTTRPASSPAGATLTPCCSRNTLSICTFGSLFLEHSSSRLSLRFRSKVFASVRLFDYPSQNSIPCHLHSSPCCVLPPVSSQCPHFIAQLLITAHLLLWHINPMRDKLHLFSPVAPLCRTTSHNNRFLVNLG